MEAPGVGCVDGVRYAVYGQYLLDVEEKREEADWYFQKANELGKDCPWTLAMVGAYWMETKRDDAKRKLEKALEMDPQHPLARAELGMYMLNHEKNKEEAKQQFETHLKEHSDHTYVRFKLGCLEKSSGNLKAAKECFRKCFQENNNGATENAELLATFAVMMHAEKNYDKARELYFQAVDMDPYNSGLLTNFALFRSDVDHEHEEAVKLYERAIALNGRNANAYYNYGTLLDSVQRDKEKAQDFYRKALVASENKHAFAAYNLAILLQEKGDFDGAQDAFELSLAANENDIVTLTDFAQFHFRIRQSIFTAEKMVQKALRLSDKTHAPAWYVLGLIYKSRGDFESAQYSFEKCIEFDSTHAIAIGELATIFADIHENPQKANELYLEALKHQPNNAQLLVNLADLLFDVMGDPNQEARTYYERARMADPSNPYIHHNYATFLLSKNETAKAKQLLQIAKEAGHHESIQLYNSI